MKGRTVSLVSLSLDHVSDFLHHCGDESLWKWWLPRNRDRIRERAAVRCFGAQKNIADLLDEVGGLFGPPFGIGHQVAVLDL
jgi:hypothetical protein